MVDDGAESQGVLDKIEAAGSKEVKITDCGVVDV